MWQGRLAESSDWQQRRLETIPNAKYDYKVMGKVAKNSRNKAQSEVVEVLRADDSNNFVTVMAILKELDKKVDVLLAKEKTAEKSQEIKS